MIPGLRRGLVLIGTSGALALVLASVAGWAEERHYLADLAVQLRAHQCVAALALVGLLAACRAWRWVALAVVVAIANGASVVPLYVPGPRENAAPHVAAWSINVNRLEDSPERVLDALRVAAPDLVVLMEVDESWLERLVPLHEAYPHRLGAPREDNFGWALMSRIPWQSAAVVELGRRSFPAIEVHLPVAGEVWTVLATHTIRPGPDGWTEWRNAQLAELETYCLTMARPLVVLGDLNCVPWSAPLRRVREHNDLRDARTGFGLCGSWPGASPLLKLPLDHCLHSPELIVRSFATGPDVGSDHLPVRVELSPRVRAAASSSGGMAIRRDRS